MYWLCYVCNPTQGRTTFLCSQLLAPSSKVGKFEELQDVLSYLESFGREIISVGDTNWDILEIADLSGSFSSQSRHMTDMDDNFGFKQLIGEPTRETVSTKTLIDQIATTRPNNIVDSGVVQLVIGDHYLIYCVRKFMGNLSKVPKVFESRQMKKFYKEKFTADLSRFHWDDDHNIAVQMWRKVFVATIDKHAPLKKEKVKMLMLLG